MNTTYLRMAIGIIVLGLTWVAGLAGTATYWQHDPPEVGDWFDPANWTAGVPADEDDAYIDNGGSALIANRDAQGSVVRLGYFGCGTVLQNSGALVVSHLLMGGHECSQGTYLLHDGLLDAGSARVGVWDGVATVVQTGGTFKVRDSLRIGRYSHITPPEPDWEGIQPSATGLYTQLAGEVETRFLRIGAGPTSSGQVLGQGIYELLGGHLAALRQSVIQGGQVRQLGGINASRHIEILGGRYEFFGGLLEGPLGLHVDGEMDFGGAETSILMEQGLIHLAGADILNAANASLIAGENSLIILAEGSDPGAKFGHYATSGLTHIAGNDLLVPAGRGFSGIGVIDDFVDCYGWINGRHQNHEGIELKGGLWVREGADVDTGQGPISVTNDRSGISGGKLQANGYLFVGRQERNEVPRAAGVFRHTGGEVDPERLYLHHGRYELSAGRLKTWYSSLGNWDVPEDPGIFIHTGGVHEVGNELEINRNARYCLLGGRIDAGIVEIGDAPPYYDVGKGTLAILDPGVLFCIGRRLALKAPAVLVAVPGSTIRFTGGGSSSSLRGEWGFTNESTDPESLEGLGNLTMIFESGAEVTSAFEVAGEDKGDGYAGYFENFALDALQIGGDDVGRVQLVDLFDNRPNWEGAEALYVESLIVGAGSSLDLNGLSLYCLDAMIDPLAMIIGGLPEPVGLAPGDANLDGAVDGADYAIWSDHYGATGAGWRSGDFNGDGIVDGIDYTLWADNYGAGAGPAGVAVPEPSFALLLVLGAWALRRRAR